MIISLDCESTGLDFHHGARPFLVTTCDQDSVQRFWEWPVNPETRQPEIPVEDLLEIQQLLDNASTIVIQNSKFDVAALATVNVVVDWAKVVDTLTAGHLLGSNLTHNLTDMAIRYLGVDIQYLEDATEEVVKQCRTKVKKNMLNWRIAQEGLEEMPSVKGGSSRDTDKPWKNDLWLPVAVANYLNAPNDDSLRTVTVDYANGDSAVTLQLWFVMEQEIKRRGLWEIFVNQMNLPRIAWKLETAGVSISKITTLDTLHQYKSESELAGAKCCAIAEQFGFNLELPRGASPNDSLRQFFWGETILSCNKCGKRESVKQWKDSITEESYQCPTCAKKKVHSRREVKFNPCLQLPYIYSQTNKSSAPTLNKEAISHYLDTLPPGIALDFIKELSGKRARDTAASFIEGYMRFWVLDNTVSGDEWYRLYPSVNPHGTDTLRWSSYNPNSQNLSKRESFSVRSCFGPDPGREWWSMDAKNLELRIPAFEAGEEDLVWIFNHPKDPPYFGSYHLVVFDLLYPEIFKEHGTAVKDLYESTLYQWVKNGNFLLIYGGQKRKADQTYHFPGAFDLVGKRFPKIAKLSAKQKYLADTLGYVETMPDKTICPDRGYPLLASRTEDGRVSPTTPLNYHISGTAMQWTNKAMIRCDRQLEQWNTEGWDGFLTLQVHDQLVFDMPKIGEYTGEGSEPWLTNMPKALELKKLMEQGGDDIGVPTLCSLTYHSKRLAGGKSFS